MASTIAGSKIAVVGAGWAGLSCAIELCAAGFAVTVYESQPIAGGRARRVNLPSGLTSDNGQHLLLGAYAETLRQIARVHPTWERNVSRLPITLASTRSYDLASDIAFQRSTFPVVGLGLGLLRAKGFSVGDRFALAGYIARCVLQTDVDLTRTVDEDIARLPTVIRERILSPLCLAALNTPSARASAKVFRNVLRATFQAGASGSDMLIPQVDLSALFPEPALNWLASHGAQTFGSETVMVLNEVKHRIEIIARHHAQTYDHVVLAVAPQHVARLLSPLPRFSAIASALGGLTYEPITTLYQSEFSLRETLPHPAILSTLDPIVQWVFHHRARQMRSVVISGADAHGEQTLDQLRHHVAQHTGTVPSVWQGITEKRATYSCTPQQYIRLATLPKPSGPIWLTGDYCYPDLPATLESATRSGRATADAIIHAQ